MHLQQRKAGNTHATATASNDVVPPLSSAPGAYSFQRDDERRDILERNEKDRPIHNQILQVMLRQQKMSTKVWPPAI